MVVTILGMLAPAAYAMAQAGLAYETIQPSHIRVGESATLRVTSLDGDLRSVPLPVVSGLSFELIGRSQGLEFVNGTSIPSTSILIRVTPQMAGIFSIPGLSPKSESLVLDVVGEDDSNPSALIKPKPTPTPPLVATTPLPKGVQLKAGGAAFVELVIPTRAVYVGESVPVDIELGLRPMTVTSVNGLPTLNGGEFTLNNLSRQPERRDKVIDGSPFLVMTWHSVIAAVKPGDFSLSVDTPLSVKINTRSAEDMAFAAWLGGPFLQSMYNGIAPKDVTVTSPSSDLKVLPLPTEGRPKDFSGAVGDFQVSSDISPARAAVGDPLTLRLRVTGVGNFDRVDSTMLGHLDHWKTYPAKSSFTPSDAVGYKGEKVFEQPLIAAQPGEQSIPGLDFSYFSPSTRRYERARTSPIKVTIAAALADGSLSAPAAAQNLQGASMSRSAQGLRPDHPQPRDSVSEFTPLYLQAPFLAVPATLALILAGSWFAVRPNPARAASRAAERALARLRAAARSGDSSSFFDVARKVLLQTFAARWQMSPDQISVAELRGRLGTAGEDIERLFALADEAKYSDHEPGGTDFQRWLELVRGQLAGESN
ncbi:MAG: BatD family protein [Steroidobacteraceae bacterium]